MQTRPALVLIVSDTRTCRSASRSFGRRLEGIGEQIAQHHFELQSIRPAGRTAAPDAAPARCPVALPARRSAMPPDESSSRSQIRSSRGRSRAKEVAQATDHVGRALGFRLHAIDHIAQPLAGFTGSEQLLARLGV
jgi:hypothetical protein